MDSLFEDKYDSHAPLRKYEPLIRYSLDGQPQPRRLLQEKPTIEIPKVSAPTPVMPTQDLKRKVSEPTPGTEPKRKQQKQQSIMAFFAKK